MSSKYGRENSYKVSKTLISYLRLKSLCMSRIVKHTSNWLHYGMVVLRKHLTCILMLSSWTCSAADCMVQRTMKKMNPPKVLTTANKLLALASKRGKERNKAPGFFE